MASECPPVEKGSQELGLRKLKQIVLKRANERGCLIPVLQELQEEEGYLSREALALVSEVLKISLSEVYGVATFYSQFRLEPPGKHVIQVCCGTACHVRGGKKVVEEFEKQLGVKSGETTLDKRFTLLSVRCFGACALGPIVRVDKEIFSRVDACNVKEILSRFK